MIKKTFQDRLLELGKTDEAQGDAVCPWCEEKHPAFAIVEDGEGLWVCSGCVMTDRLEARADEIVAEEAAKPAWENDRAVGMKMQRTMLLDKYRWTIMPDSPLAPANRAAWLLYLKKLHRLTLDFSKPEDVIWPEPPALIYGATT